MATPRTIKGISDEEWAAVSAAAAAAGLPIGRFVVAACTARAGEPIAVIAPRQPRQDRRQDGPAPAPAADLDRAERLVRLGMEAGGRATQAARRLAVALIDGAAPSVPTVPTVRLSLPAPEAEAAE